MSMKVFVFIYVMAYRYWSQEKKALAVTFGALALLFQPFLKVSLGRTMWNIVDVIVAVGLLLLVLLNKEKKE